jgi:hypothetical protein
MSNYISIVRVKNYSQVQTTVLPSIANIDMQIVQRNNLSVHWVRTLMILRTGGAEEYFHLIYARATLADLPLEK